MAMNHTTQLANVALTQHQWIYISTYRQVWRRTDVWPRFNNVFTFGFDSKKRDFLFKKKDVLSFEYGSNTYLDLSY